MKIGIVGCGALGSYYGACLARAGNEVHFLLRSDFETVRREGVSVESPAGDFHVRPHAARHPDEIGSCDLVVIGLKTTANSLFPELVLPLVSTSSRVLTLQNGLGSEEALARIIPEDQIMGGLCFVCINRTGPGKIRHIAHGRIVMGQFNAPPNERTEGIAALFRSAGIPCEIAQDLGFAHWQKLVWNVPFNGLGVASAAGLEALDQVTPPTTVDPRQCLSSDQLLANPEWETRVRELMREVILTARALGHDIPHDYAQFQIERTLEMGPYLASTILDFLERRPLELESLFLTPLRHARRQMVDTPHLVRLCQLLTFLAKHHGQEIPD